MFNPEKDFCRILFECLGRDGMSISALAKDLEKKGFKHHRLILTGYLRAMTDIGNLKERDIPPSKIYLVSKTLPDTVYEQVGKACRKATNDPDELILYILFRLYKRPIFDSELKMAGVTRPIGVRACDDDVNECKKILKRSGNTVIGQVAVTPSSDLSEKLPEILLSMILDSTDSRHLIAETKQSKLM